MLKVLTQTKAEVILFGGGFAGGKSYGSISIIIGYCIMYPKTRYAICRKTLAILKQTSLLTFFDVCSNAGLIQNVHYTFNKQDMRVTFYNDSEIFFKGTDSPEDPNMNSLKLDLTACLIEEADEIKVDAFNLLKGRIGRRNAMGKVKRFMLLTCNPSNTWVKTEFILPFKEGNLREDYAFIQSLAVDNKYNSQDYINGLGKLPESERQRYLLGSWDQLDDPSQLITFAILQNNLVDELPLGYKGDLRLGIDVARSGSDSTTYKIIDDEKVVYSKKMLGNDIHQSSIIAKNLIDEYRVLHNNVHIDTIGLGAGVYDNLVTWGYSVSGFNSAESPSKKRDDSFEFFNKRAEGHWNLRTRFSENKLMILKSDVDLIQELLAARYENRGKKVIIEPKEKIKERLGRSPDEADALVMANYNPDTTDFFVSTTYL